KCFFIQLGFYPWQGEQGFNLRTECKHSTLCSIIKRFLPCPVARKKEFLFLLVPQCECKHAIEIFKATFTMFLIKGQHHFRITAAFVMMISGSRTDFVVVINFAVEHNCVSTR